MKAVGLIGLVLLSIIGLPLSTAARPVLAPSAIESGGASLLRWQGPAPSALSVTFNGRDITVQPATDAILALIGADLEMPPGKYLVTLSGRDAEQRDFAYALPLEVRAVERPEERLTLPEEMVTPKSPEVRQRIAREYEMLQKLFAVSRPAPAPEAFQLPVDDPLGSLFGLRRILNGQAKSPHAGVDFRSPRGTPVHAPGQGLTVFAGDLYYTGKTVVLDHGGGLFSLYAHLDEIETREGAEVAGGELLGRVGSTGRSTGPHLHWGIKLRGDRIDPLAMVQLFAD